MMGLLQWALALVLLTLSTTSAFNTLVPEGKEVIYDYQGLVKAGTRYPASYASQFLLLGKVHLQSTPNATLVKLSNLSYKLYNGVLDHVHEVDTHEMPLPPEVSDLEKVFKIVYDSRGKAVGISTEVEEKEYTRNIKKGIATVLQLDVGHMDKMVKGDFKHSYAFTTKEHSIHGYSTVNYNVLPLNSNGMEILKMDYKHDHPIQIQMSNVLSASGDMTKEEPLMKDNQKKYIIVKEDDMPLVQRIEAVGGIFYHPFEAKSDFQLVVVNQTFKMVQVVPIEQPMQLMSEHFDNNLDYHIADDEVPTEVIIDITNGRRNIDYQKLVPQVYQLLEEMWTYSQQDHLNDKHMDVSQIKQGQLVNRVQRLLGFFDVQRMEEMQSSLQPKPDVLELFDNILPLVGTRASALVIKKLVMHKEVKDDVAVHMLQHLPTHVAMPTIALVTELVPLIHMDDKISWSVKKAAILSFATLINNSHMFMMKQQSKKRHQESENDALHHIDSHTIQEYFEKYVIEYVNKIRSTDDYKLQMVYMAGLLNMNLDSVLQHMKPAIMGEWWPNHHFRVMALMSAVPVALKDPSLMHETLWPILANQKEHTILRMMAYYYLMETEPVLTTLGNIYWYLMHEPDQELYHFHYTYVSSMMQSVEPSKQEFKLRLAQIMKYMQPPSHGLSTAQMSDYKDSTYGFSGGLNGFFVHTNDSELFAVSTKSQLFHQYNEDYLVYIKIYGSKTLSDIINNGFTSINSIMALFDGSISHVEIVLFKHDKVINTFFFSENSMDEVKAFMDLYKKDQHKTMTKMLHVSYEIYKKTLMPTDLGFPMVWQVSAPMVQKTDIKFDKKVLNDIVNLHVDTHYVSWMAAQHGLSFYNPILDIWQGISRVHQHHIVWPLHWDIGFNKQQLTLKMAWSKHNELEKDVAGMKSHVTSMVFIRDDHKRNMLHKSSPRNKEMEMVSEGDDYRHDYTLVDKDDLNTGHKWQVKVFDSNHHISNGSFNHLMNTFIQTDNKNVHSPMSHLMISLLHGYRYTMLMPRPGTYGVLMKVEPSHEHSVSNIDLSLRMGLEVLNEEYIYAPKSKWSTRMTYAIKNKEQSLKTWDVTGNFDMNEGHTVNNLKAFMTRIIPGQKDYKVCINGIKKWTQKGVSGHLNIATSHTADSKCAKDDTVVDVTMTGEKSKEQEYEDHVYGSCQYTIPYSVEAYHTLHCLQSHTSVRHYVYNVKTTNVPGEFKKVFWQAWDLLKSLYMSYYNHEDEHNENIGENNLKVDVVYPMDGGQIDMQVFTPNHHHQLTGIPTKHWQWLGVVPDSTVYSENFIFKHTMGGQIDHCIVHHDHFQLNDHPVVHEMVPTEWKPYVAITKQNPSRAVYIKHLQEHKIAVKVVDNSPTDPSQTQHVLEIAPHINGPQVTVDGRLLQNKEHYNDDWVSVMVFTHDVKQPVVVMLHQLGVHLEYTQQNMVIMVPKLAQPWHGHCYEQ